MHEGSWGLGGQSISNQTQEGEGEGQLKWLLLLSLLLWPGKILQGAFSGRFSFSCDESSFGMSMNAIFLQQIWAHYFLSLETDKRRNCPLEQWKREIQCGKWKWEIFSNSVHFLSCLTPICNLRQLFFFIMETQFLQFERNPIGRWKWEILSNPVHFLSCLTQFSLFLIFNVLQREKSDFQRKKSNFQISLGACKMLIPTWSSHFCCWT